MSMRGTDEAARHGIGRSPKWHEVEKAHIEKQCTCQACGSLVRLQVHHIFPFHYCVALGRPDLELGDRNLITLCEEETNDHHLLIGHLDNFKSSNLNVKQDTEVYAHMTKSSIEGNDVWQGEEKNRLKPLDEMTDEDKANFVTLMNSTYPLQGVDDGKSS